MLDFLFTNLLTANITFASFMYCTLASVVLGIIISLTAKFKSHETGGFCMTLGILPFIVQVLMMLVNGNIGIGVAVAGAFSLVRFRSVQGTAREILLVFLAMAVGLSCGVGYVGVAAMLAVISIIFITVSTIIIEKTEKERELRITIPEDLNYTEVFDDVFGEYTKRADLISVKSTNMGSLYKLRYRIVLRDEKKEKELIDALRVKNGNLEIMCARLAVSEGREL